MKFRWQQMLNVALRLQLGPNTCFRRSLKKRHSKNQGAAWLEHTLRFRKSRPIVRNMFKNILREHQVKTCIRKGQIAKILVPDPEMSL